MGDAILLGENILDDDDFLSADEQAGVYIGQPEPNAANTGGLRVIASGDVAAAVVTGTTTADGNVGGTTFIDLSLNCYGQLWFSRQYASVVIGGETRTINASVQASGQCTVSVAFSGQVTSGTAYTITIPIRGAGVYGLQNLEILTGGDLGTATYKWSPTGDSTFFGRDTINQADWLAETEITNDAEWQGTYLSKMNIVQADNGDWICFHRDASTDDTMIEKSTDNGRTWANVTTLTSAGDNVAGAAIKLKSGRLLCYNHETGADVQTVFYSDDDGATWAGQLVGGEYAGANLLFVMDAVELASGTICYVGPFVAGVFAYFSSDGGFTITGAVGINPGTYSLPEASLTLNAGGDIVCVYAGDDDSAGDIEIKAKISTDNGATWGSEIDVLNFGATDIMAPYVVTDINGDLYCAAIEMVADNGVVYSRSTDGGQTWGAQTDLKTVGAADLAAPHLSIIDGHQVICSYIDSTNDAGDFVRRGIWEEYSANDIPVPINGIKSELTNGYGITWLGSGGIDGDEWDFEPEYEYAMENIIDPSPSKPWRSTTDGAELDIVISVGSGLRHQADSVAFFGCNLRTIQVIGGTTETVSFDLSGTITVGNVDAGNTFYTPTESGVKSHEWAGEYVRFLTGAEADNTYKLLDNLVVDGANTRYLVDIEAGETIDLAEDDTAVVYGKSAYKAFGQNIQQQWTITIPAQETAEGYYQIGFMILSEETGLSRGWGTNYGKSNIYAIQKLRTPAAGIVNIKSAERKRVFSLSWDATADSRDEVLSLMDYIGIKPIGLVPDADVVTDVYNVTMSGNEISSTYVGRDRWQFGPVILEEIL